MTICTQTASEFLIVFQIFDFLFALPNPKLRHVPKCKSPRSRTAAFDLLVELVKGAPTNYAILHEKLLQQHQPGTTIENFILNTPLQIFCFL